MLKWILYEWCGLNEWLFLRIHGDDTRPGVAVVMKGLSLLGDYRLVPAYLALGLALTWFLRRSGRGDAASSVRGANWRLLIGYAICFVLVGTLKVTFELPRPDSTLNVDAIPAAVDGDLRYSLPSGHAAFVALLAMSLWPLLQLRGRVAIGAFVLAVGYSRIWLGSHYPADVVAGYFCGLVAAWLATRIGRTWRMRA
jgi:signal peptidase II